MWSNHSKVEKLAVRSSQNVDLDHGLKQEDRSEAPIDHLDGFNCLSDPSKEIQTHVYMVKKI